jgi:hypothetical protein
MAVLNLRKALSLKKKLEAKIKAANIGEPNVFIDLDDAAAQADLPAFLAKAETAHIALVEEQVRLSLILSSLRKRISAANIEHGIDPLLADVNHIERQIELYKALASVEPVNAELVKAKLERKQRESSAVQQVPAYAHMRGQDGGMRVGPLGEDRIKSAKATLVALRLEKEALEDKRLAANATGTVEIGDDDVEFLKGLGIV